MGETVTGPAPSTDVSNRVESRETNVKRSRGFLAMLRRLYDKAYLYPCF